jgi:deoxyribodipyrimidine photo-lyase
MKNISVFWFRRDLRLADNTGLFYALSNEQNVLPIFIFDKAILDVLEDRSDARVTFIHQQIHLLQEKLKSLGSTLYVKYGQPLPIFEELSTEFNIKNVYTNRDYEPYANKRDLAISEWLKSKGIQFLDFKDQVIFEKNEISNGSGEFYKVFTPYSKIWIQKFEALKIQFCDSSPYYSNFVPLEAIEIPTLEEMNFQATTIPLPSSKIKEGIIEKYDENRNFPALDGTSRIGIHLRFGTISIRELALKAYSTNKVFLSELIWREFYMMLLHHQPQLVDKAFKPKYDTIQWRKAPEDFEKWCEGKTGYPIVDAGMRELNATGHMHNRVRMIVASFLTKHLLIDWRWGEAYFAKKLLDFELSSNNGGWQWAAGTGTDAQPYFRIFNPESQTSKFDKNLKYIKKWIPEWGTPNYPKPMVDHKLARERALNTYKTALEK